ncbi:hypothetical protein NDI85_15345 [Halomicroarcula sp. S1AR25-4]|uniref:hypothetical protein n=1 Tax=Haloarcula sp. S1AR25-4 TaxID=2950538 RepID=UPI0028752894|nr:hypothetical protein [Halomicroarcula sp. S1AR25-4]MDS0279174.1 hypothetical protein [Halomicroarcula sp. S1AR25-4]
MADTPAVYDHYRPSGADYPDGVYRVVGTDDDGVTLLRVADAGGRRRHTGEVVTVPTADLSGFEATENPDGNRSRRAVVRSSLDGLYWSARAFVQTLAERPLLSTAALALLLAGEFGRDVLSLSGLQAGALIVVGGLALVYIGSGRL